MRIRKCKTCGCPLWAACLITGRPWQKRYTKFKQAKDCADLLPKKLCDRLWKEAVAEAEESNYGEEKDY